jgi:hypothetical protein
MATYTRTLALPRAPSSCSARGTGKTTWLRQGCRARWYDLIRDCEVLRLTRDPEVFTQEVRAGGSRVVVDEVQRLPALLNDVRT